MKKTIIIIGVILGILALAGGVYFAWKKSKEVLTPPPAVDQRLPDYNLQPTTNNQQPALTAGNLKIIGDQPVFDYWIYTTSSTEQIFYLNREGKVFMVKDDGEDEIISPQTIENLRAIKADSDGGRVLIKSGKADAPQFNIFNAAERVWELLPSEITAADFSPDAQKIAYLKTNGDKSDLFIKNIASAKTAKTISLFQKDFDLKWLTDETILLIPKPSRQTVSDIWKINIKNKTVKKITSGRGLMVNWSANGDLGMKFSVDLRRNPHLDLIDNEGAVRINFDFSTLPEKCLIVGEEKIFCAVPQTNNSIKKPVLPDDYLKKSVYFEDFIYKMNIKESASEAIYAKTNPIIDAFRLSLNNNQLFFINRYDNRIYGLNLE